MTSKIQDSTHNSRLTSRFGAEDIEILDAGLGTTLEDVLQKNISHPLWSAHLIESDAESIVAAHLAFLKAGSSVILTATYQCAPETFSRAGYSAKQASVIMHKAVTLAVRARDSYMETLPPNMPMPKIALSLGPYGATLSPAAEFTGIYPPPYGPSRPVTFFAGGQADNTQKERDAEDLLVQFHLERLRIMSSSKETWDAIDIIAFETIPLLREARSIRRAMTLLAETNPSTRLPPWWISFTFPNGVLPEQRADGVHCSAGDALKSCFEQYSPASIAVPSAFGINCTQVKYLSKCLSLASEALQHLGDNLPISDQNMLFSHHQRQRTGPGLVLYCNGGRVYNPNTMTWLPVASTSSSLKDLPESEVWAVGMAEAVYEGVSTKANWGGLLIGGCCKTEPEHILALRNLI